MDGRGYGGLYPLFRHFPAPLRNRIRVKRNSDTILVGIAFLAFIGLGLSVGILGVAWPSIRDTFGVSLDAIGGMLLPSTAGALLVSLNSGPIIKRMGLGPVLLIGFLIGGLAFLGIALAPSWWTVVVVSFIGAMGTSAVVAGLNTYFAMSKSAKLMNWLQACFGLGATLSPMMLAVQLDKGLSWRWGYVVVAVCFLALAGAVGLTLKQWQLMTSSPSESENQGPSQAPSGATLRIPFVWLSILLYFVFTGFEVTAGQWPYTLFTEARSIDPAIAGLWVSIFYLSLTVGRVFFGFVVDRVGIVPVIRGAMAGAIVASALIWLNTSATVSFIGFALIGFTVAPLFPVLTSDTPRRLGTAHAANSIGFQLASSRLGLAIIPALAGVLAESLGLEVIAPFLFAVAVAQFVLYELTLLKRLQPGQNPHPVD